MPDIEISPLVETWKIANLTFVPLALVDVPGLGASHPLPPVGGDGEPVWIDALDYTTADLLAASDNFRNALISTPPSVATEGYKHTHKGLYDPSQLDAPHTMPDATTWHSHSGLEILTGGATSNADSLHTHADLTTSSEVDAAISSAIGDLDLSVYVEKSGSISQLSDITSDGATIEAAVTLAHAQDHSLLDHIDDIDPFTIANFRKLLDGSNADCYHTHSTGGGTFDGEHNDLDGLNDGDYVHLTVVEYSNFGTLTDGSNADALHTHAGGGGTFDGVHNDLDGLQGGTSLDPSATEEYYHLDYDQYISLVGGPSIGADEYHTHNFPTTAYEMPLGPTCDAGWDGGLFAWGEDYLTSCALDDLNEVMAALAPPAAPDLDDADVDTSGVTGDVSFDVSNPIAEATYVGVTGIGSLPAVTVDNPFTNSGDRVGIINATTDITGTLNEDVAAHAYSYPANAFGNAELGELILEVNGVEVRTIDLTTAGAVNDGTATSGFNISDKTPCEFSNGDPFVQFQYRTGSYRVDSGDANLGYGWNYARVIHRIDGVDSTTNYIDWVVDANAATTSYSGILFDNLAMSNNSNDSDFLSGVEYWRAGNADYDVVINNGQRNTYITGSAITFTETNGSVSNQAFLDTSGNELQQRTLADLTFTISSSIRLLNENITNRTNVNRTIDANEANSSTSTIASILMDDLINHTATANASENFNGEGYRLPSNVSITSISYASGAQNGPVVWDPQLTIADAGTTGYNDGLLVYNSSVRYPTQGVLSGDFRDDGDGGSIAYAPSGNVDYSSGATTGEREYLCYFYDSSSRQNFTFNFTVNNTTFVAATNRGSLSGNNVTCEILAPNTTVNGSATVEFKDMVTAYTVDTAIGAYYASFGSTVPTNWGVSIGSKATATSGYAIVVRITASASWTGYISNITCTFL